MRAFITGINGFAAGFLAEHLLAVGDAVCGCSRTGTWAGQAPAELPAQIPLVAWDLAASDPLSDDAWQRLIDFAPDCIYHLAAISVPAQCGRDDPTPEAWAANVEGTERVLDLAADLPTRPRVLFVSTSHVYSPVKSSDSRVAEDAPLGPVRGYGRTKLQAEQAVQQSRQNAGVDAVIARAFQHTGPRQQLPMMLPEWAQQFARACSGPVRVMNRDTWIDLTDVRDVVRAYRALAQRGKSGVTYNVGSGISRGTGDVLDALRRLAGSDREILEVNPGLKQDPIADNRRLVQCTGWSPKIPLEQTLGDTLAYWRQREAVLPAAR